ncbi:MAG: hypothetical protein NTW19_00405 [Planctomycetota bacterium]|nr:hypothetical protein [Planctomycetota bacterium]
MPLQEDLRQLFLLDQQLRGMRSRLDSATTRHQRQLKKLEQSNRQKSELADQYKQAQVKVTGLEKQAAEIEQRITTLREQMNTVKNHKEYQALVVEVNTIKVEKGKSEDQALEHMTKAETLKNELDAITADVLAQEKLVVVAENEVKTCRAELGKQLDELTAKRDLAAQELPTDVRVTFERIAVLHDGDAMAHIILEDRKNMEYSCSGCYMQQPIERVSALMSRGSQITCCASCGRILYLEPELKEAISPTK